MKKLYLTLLVSVMALTLALGLKVSAETTTTPSDGYTWLDDYTTAGKKVMYLKNDRTNFGVYGYSGTDVILGNWVYTVAKGNVLIPGEDMSIPAVGWPSFGQLYYNNSTEDWYIPRAIETSFVLLFIDANGQVYQIDNSYAAFDLGTCVPKDGGEPIVPTDPLNQCAQATADVQLRYLDSSLTGALSKAGIDANKATDVTFNDGDLVYVDKDKKFTNVATDNTPVIKQQQSVFTAEDPLVKDGKATAGQLKYTYKDGETVIYTNQSVVEGFTVTPVLENVKGTVWTNGTAESAFDVDYDAENDGAYGFNQFVVQKAITNYDVWWDDVAGEMKYRQTPWLKHIPHEDAQLTYADLSGGTNGTYYWLTKATVDSKTATGITFTDTDKLYKDSDGKYTNVATDNTAVMNEDLGFKIPVGGAVLALEYLDRANFNTTDYLKSFYTLVNGQDSIAQIVEHDTNKPVISGTQEKIDVLINKEYKNYLDGVSAADFGKMTILGDEITPEVTASIYGYNKETEKFDIELTEVNTDLAGVQYHIVYEATDASGNVTTNVTEVTVVAGYSPVFTGIGNLTINEGEAVDLLEGITADDGYGNDITNKIVVYKGNFNPDKPVVGTYEVLYTVVNANNTVKLVTATITVLDTTSPVVTPIGDIEVIQGTDFDLKTPVQAFDNVDNVFAVVVKDDGGYNKDKAGTYNIKLEVFDNSGNKTVVEYKITVIATGQDIDSKISDLQTKYEELKNKTAGKDQSALIFTAIVALFAVGGTTLGVTSLFKRN